MLKIFTVTLLFFSFFTNAAIYKCTVDGIDTYSQQPCSAKANEVEIKVQNTYQSKLKPTKTQLKNNDNEVNSYILKRKIRMHNENIAKIKRKMERELATLKARTYYAANNLAGAQYQTALSQEMIAVTNKYATLISDEERKIKALKSNIE